MTSPLDNPIWSALTGPQSGLAERHGRAARYPADLSPFHAIAGPDGWDDLHALAGPGAEIFMSGPYLDVPPGWEMPVRLAGVQMVGARVEGRPEPAAEVLGPADVPEMLDLVERTKPGPFRKRTVEFGAYLGFREGGRLIAMAGERIRVPGYTEISGVCTDPAFQGRGLAVRLMRSLAHDIKQRGETPFLAALASNAPALRVYRRLGFEHRLDVEFTAVRTPRTRPSS